MQAECIQLCKTLYTLLQGSADEEELFEAMGRVAKFLLGLQREPSRGQVTSGNIGPVGGRDLADNKELVDNKDPESIKYPAAVLAVSSQPADALCRTSAVDRETETKTEVSSSIPDSSEWMKAPNADDASSKASTVEKEDEATEENGYRLLEENNVPHASTGFEGSFSSSHESHNCTSLDAPNVSRDKELESSSGYENFEQALANTMHHYNKEEWMLTFEQFVGALQLEPVLCQFFAEQNTMDLSGSSVDPVLNPYTRTIMATSSP